jgi:hypothetical protein
MKFTPERIIEIFRDAGMNFEPSPNALYTVRGQHAQLIEGCRAALVEAELARASEAAAVVPAIYQFRCKGSVKWMDIANERALNGYKSDGGYETRIVYATPQPASEQRTLTEDQIIDEFERHGMSLRYESGAPKVDAGRVIDSVRALLAAKGDSHADK